jgi:predicted AlkP superfamily phosphohydrolase/phosphomutase
MPGARSRVLILGLDGADLDVIRPLAAAGRLPHLAAWLEAGRVAPLPSTVPPMSFPAWSSFATGLAPGRHGIFDFTQKLAGAYRIRFVNAGDRAGASLFARASRAGRSVLALGVPASFPPEPVVGLLVPGFDAPVSTGSDPRTASDPALYARVAARAGPWMRPDLDEAARGSGWHERAIATLLERVDRKTAFALEALRALREAGREPELAAVVFSESDTVAHHFWRDHDPASPRHDPAAGALRRGAVAAVFERLDRAAGALRDAFGDDALCLVLSDHGQGGASRRVLHLNGRLAECGLAARQRGRGLDEVARRARDLGLRALPPRAAQGLFRRLRGSAARLESAARFGGFDWSRTLAFSEEANTQPGVWINLAGREAAGCVAATDYERVRDVVIDALLDWKLPGGPAALARARRREEVYEGPYVERAPDVVVELALESGYAHSLVATPWNAPHPCSVRTLERHELGGGRGRGMNGVHRPDGLWIAGGGAAAAREPVASIAAVAPAVLRAIGLDAAADAPAAPPAPAPYSPDEEARVAARLRDLGYLE